MNFRNSTIALACSEFTASIDVNVGERGLKQREEPSSRALLCLFPRQKIRVSRLGWARGTDHVHVLLLGSSEGHKVALRLRQRDGVGPIPVVMIGIGVFPEADRTELN
jgi:hypothetical protein